MYKFDNSGNADIVIRTIADMNILGTSYSKGDVFAIFENAYFSLEFSNNNKLITQGSRPLMHYNSMNLSALIIQQKSTNYSSYNFIASSKTEDTAIIIPVKENILTDFSGVCFLTRVPTNQKPIFIKNSEQVNVTGYTVDYTTGQVSNLSPNKSYLVYYYYQDINLVTYSLDKIEIPYFEIDIMGEGNVNGISRKIYVNIPKSSIDIKTLLEFSKGKIASADIVFGVIDGKGTITYY